MSERSTIDEDGTQRWREVVLRESQSSFHGTVSSSSEDITDVIYDIRDHLENDEEDEAREIVEEIVDALESVGDNTE